MNLHRTLGLVAAAAAVGSIGVAPASGQDELPDMKLSAKAWATPSKAGTKRHPRGVTLNATVKIDVEPGFEPPIVTGADVLVGKGLVWNADDYVKCAKPVLDRKGPGGCPKKSIMGSAKATARADTVLTTAGVVLINGGWRRTFAYTTLYNPAFVQETIVVKRTKMSGKWGHRESFRVPENLQIVAGVPIQVTAAQLRVGGKPYARDYIVSTSCPKGGWKYRAVAHYLFSTGATSDESFDGRVPCTK